MLKVGDTVTRMLSGVSPMKLKITDIINNEPGMVPCVVCGPWMFDYFSGAEIDEELGWDENGTGSYLLEIALANHVQINLIGV